MISHEAMQAAREEVVRLSQANGGVISPRDLTEAARDPESPLHPCYNWDVDEAAMAHWDEVSRRLIRSCRIEFTVDNKRVEAVAYVKDPDSQEAQYIEVERVRSDVDKKRETLLAEYRRISGMVQRTRALARYFDATEEVDELLGQLQEFQVKLEQPHSRN